MTVVGDLFLDLGEGHHVYDHTHAVLRHFFCQLDDLFLCFLAGVGIAVEVHRLDHHAALHGQKSRHRAVDAAGEQHHAPTAAA